MADVVSEGRRLTYGELTAEKYKSRLKDADWPRSVPEARIAVTQLVNALEQTEACWRAALARLEGETP